jgi:flagellar motor switch protein FliN/FliY
MADELKEETTDSLESEEAQAPEEVGSGELEKSTEEAAAEEAMMAMAEEEAARAEAGLAEPEETPEEIAADEDMLAMVEQEADAGEVVGGPDAGNKNLDLLMDVNLQITVELGRKDMNFGDILQLGRGSIVELNKMADEPVDIYVNQSKIAQGEVVVVDEHFGVRVTKLLSSARIKKLG